MRIANATVRSTTFGYEGHGILSAMLGLDCGDNSVQGFGGWNLTISAACGLFVRRVLEVTGAESWEKVRGRPVRVKCEDGYNGRIVALGHYLKDEWFDPAAEFAAMEADQPTTAVRL